MRTIIHPYDVAQDAEMLEPLDFNRRSRLKHVDRTFKSELLNVIRLTEMEKLFQVRIIDPVERERFSFLPGQFVMLELPGYGEVPISISSSPAKRSSIELCIRRAGVVTGALRQPSAKMRTEWVAKKSSRPSIKRIMRKPLRQAVVRKADIRGRGFVHSAGVMTY